MKFKYGKFGAPLFISGVPLRECGGCKKEFWMDEMYALIPILPIGGDLEALKECGSLLRCKDCIPEGSEPADEEMEMQSGNR